MTKCKECAADLSAGAAYCSACGAQVGVKRDVFEVSSERLVGKVKEILKDINVKRVTVKDEKGNVILSMPVTWGAVGAIATLAIAPWLAALGVIAGIATKCTIVVERSDARVVS